jgi:hypothetical protein
LGADAAYAGVDLLLSSQWPQYINAPDSLAGAPRQTLPA